MGCAKFVSLSLLEFRVIALFPKVTVGMVISSIWLQSRFITASAFFVLIASVLISLCNQCDLCFVWSLITAIIAGGPKLCVFLQGLETGFCVSVVVAV